MTDGVLRGVLAPGDSAVHLNLCDRNARWLRLRLRHGEGGCVELQAAGASVLSTDGKAVLEVQVEGSTLVPVTVSGSHLQHAVDYDLEVEPVMGGQL